MIVSLHSAPAAAFSHSSVSRHIPWLIFKEYMCAHLSGKNLPTEMHRPTLLKTLTLNHTPTTPPHHPCHSLFSFLCFFSHALPRMSGQTSLTPQCRNVPFSLHIFSCLCLPAAVGWELTDDKRTACFSSTK